MSPASKCQESRVAGALRSPQAEPQAAGAWPGEPWLWAGALSALLAVGRVTSGPHHMGSLQGCVSGLMTQPPAAHRAGEQRQKRVRSHDVFFSFVLEETYINSAATLQGPALMQCRKGVDTKMWPPGRHLGDGHTRVDTWKPCISETLPSNEPDP